MDDSNKDNANESNGAKDSIKKIENFVHKIVGIVLRYRKEHFKFLIFLGFIIFIMGFFLPNIKWARISIIVALFIELFALCRRDNLEWFKDEKKRRILVDIFTVFSIFVVIFIFIFNTCWEQKQTREEYVNQLEALKSEIEFNYDHIIKYVLKDKEGYLKGNDTAFYPFNHKILDKIIMEGRLSNKTKLVHFYEISFFESQANRALELVWDMQTDPGFYINDEMTQVLWRGVKTGNYIFINRTEILHKKHNKSIEFINKEIAKQSEKRNNKICKVNVKIVNKITQLIGN